jgi:hypothetical protein
MTYQVWAASLDSRCPEVSWFSILGKMVKKMASSSTTSPLFCVLDSLCKKIKSAQSPSERYVNQVALLKYICSDPFQALLVVDPQIAIDACLREAGMPLNCSMLRQIWSSFSFRDIAKTFRMSGEGVHPSSCGLGGDDLYWFNVLLTSAQACSDLYSLDSEGLLRYWDIHSYCRIAHWSERGNENIASALELERLALEAIRGSEGLYCHKDHIILTLVSSQYLDSAGIWLSSLTISDNSPETIVIGALDEKAFEVLSAMIYPLKDLGAEILLLQYFYDFAARPLYGSLEMPPMNSFWCHKTALVLALTSCCDTLIVSDIDAFWLNGLLAYVRKEIRSANFVAQPVRGVPFPLSKVFGKIACQGYYAINCLSVPKSVMRFMLMLAGVYGDDQTAFNSLIYFMSKPDTLLPRLSEPGCARLKLIPEAISPRGGPLEKWSILYHPQVSGQEDTCDIRNIISGYHGCSL